MVILLILHISLISRNFTIHHIQLILTQGTSGDFVRKIEQSVTHNLIVIIRAVNCQPLSIDIHAIPRMWDISVKISGNHNGIQTSLIRKQLEAGCIAGTYSLFLQQNTIGIKGIMKAFIHVFEVVFLCIFQSCIIILRAHAQIIIDCNFFLQIAHPILDDFLRDLLYLCLNRLLLLFYFLPCHIVLNQQIIRIRIKRYGAHPQDERILINCLIPCIHQIIAVTAFPEVIQRNTGISIQHVHCEIFSQCTVGVHMLTD